MHVKDMEEKKSITIAIADLKPIPLVIDPKVESDYRQVEEMVNRLWNKWSVMFASKVSQQELLARIALQFARLYNAAYKQNEQCEAMLKGLEQKLEKLAADEGLLPSEARR